MASAIKPNLSGKVTIVTGASSGIGAGIAKLFSSHGAQLVLTGRNADNLNRVAEECAKHGTKPVTVIADLASEAETGSIVDQTVQKFGKIDILVNNAGIFELGSIESTSLKQYDRTMNTNLRSMYQLTMLAVPHLIKTRGNIVNVSSVAGIRAFPNCLSYNLSKAAIDQFTRCVALELAPRQVRCNCVSPGLIVTEIFQRGGMTEEDFNNFKKTSEQQHPLGRAGEVTEVAAAVAFLASDAASFITGVQLPIDGGRSV